MKFTILINQKAAIDSGLQLDIVDLAIFDLLHNFSHTHQCQKIKEDEQTFYLFHWKLINQQLPIIGLNSRHSVYQRMKKLTEAGILIPSKDNAANSTSFYRFGPAHEQFIFSSNVGVMKTTPSGNENTPNPVNENTPNKSIKSDNTISDNEYVVQKKTEFINSIVEWQVAHPNKYPKILYRNFFNYWSEFGKKKRDKRPRLRFESQEFFELGKRLATWFSNCNDADVISWWSAEQKLPELKTFLLNLLNG